MDDNEDIGQRERAPQTGPVQPGSPWSINDSRAERIAIAVERENRQRNLLLRVYLGLLFVPVIIGIGFLLFGRTDRQFVQDELEARITPVESRYKSIEAKFREIEPLLDRAQDVDGQTGMRRQPTDPSAPYAREQQEAVVKIEHIRRELSELKSELQAETERERQLSARIGELQQVIGAMAENIKSLETQKKSQ